MKWFKMAFFPFILQLQYLSCMQENNLDFLVSFLLKVSHSFLIMTRFNGYHCESRHSANEVSHEIMFTVPLT